MLPFVVSTFDDQVDDVVSKRPNCTNCLDHICTFDWRLAKVDHVYRFYVNRFWFIVLKCVILVVFISMTNIFLSEATRWIFYI